jgi:serine/threonine-protein kinase
VSDGLFPLLTTGGFSPGLRVAGYSLEEQIGRGGMAVVFRALDERLNRQVALKILAPALAADVAFRQRFIRESRAAAAVDDPNIIPVFGAGEADGVLFIAMRLVRGGDLRTLVATQGPLSPARAAWIVSAVASALDAAHAAGLVHRDVKPANMLLDVRPGRPDHVYLSDFGLTKGSLTSAALTNLSGTGLFMGTVDYAAPEQIQGKAVDGRTDQYALGCSAFELLCGQPPFTRDQGLATIYAHLSEPPPPLALREPGLPPAVDDVFAKVLAKSPDNRYATCQEFAEALRSAISQQAYQAGGRAAGPYPPGVAEVPHARPATHSGPVGAPDGVGAGQPDGAAGAAHVDHPDQAPTGPQKTPARKRFPVRRPGKRTPARGAPPEAATRDMVMRGASIADTVLPSTADTVLPDAAGAGAAAEAEAAQQLTPETAAPPVVPGAAVPTAAPDAAASQVAAPADLVPEAAAPEAAVPAADADTVTPEAAVPQADADTVAPDAPVVPDVAVPDVVVSAMVAPVMPTAQPAEADTVLPEPVAAATAASQAPAVPGAAAAVTMAPDSATANGASGAATVAPDAAAAQAAANTFVPNASGLDTVFPPAGAAAGGDGGPERPERQRSLLRSRPLAIGLAAGLVVIGGGVGLLLTRSPSSPSLSTAASYSFATHQYPDGLVIARRWTLSGSNDTVLTETITASSATGKALAVPFDEPIPAAIAASPQALDFTPVPSKILDGGRLVQWNLRVPASGSIVVGYRATVAPSGGAKAQLNRWATEFDALPVGPGIGTIGPSPADLRSLRISPSSVRLAVGHTVQLTLSGELSDGKSAPSTTLSAVAWQSADPAVATVSSSGKVTGKKPGSTRVTAQRGPISVSIGVTVTKGTSTAPGPQPTSAPDPPPVTTGPAPTPVNTSPPPPPPTPQPTPTLTPTSLGPEIPAAAEDAVQGPAVPVATAQRSARARAPGSAVRLMHALRLALLSVALLSIF